MVATLLLIARDEGASGPATKLPKGEPGSRISWNGQDWYLQGVNMPWYNWACDFGCNDGGGVSSSESRAAISERFARLDKDGMRAVRWWLFPGDPWQVTRSSSGAPRGIDPAVYKDIDAALALAGKYDLTYTFTLFSAPSAVPRTWITDGSQRKELADVLGELFAHYAKDPRVMTWEVINEPEWEMWKGDIGERDLQEFVRAIAASVHAHSEANVTVGSAMLDGLPTWQGLGLSYYDAHWYDHMTPGQWCAPCTDYAEVRERYDLDAPLVIGEFYAGSDVNASQRMADWYAKGYAGAFAWSLFPEKTMDHQEVDFAAAAKFARQVQDAGPHRQ